MKTRRERRVVGSVYRQSRRFWIRVRNDIGNERVDSWSDTGDLAHLGPEVSRELITLMHHWADKMKEARR